MKCGTAPALCLLFFLIGHLESARILVVLPLPLWSHYMQFQRLWEALAQRGHEMTVYSAFPPKSPIPNFRHVNFTLTKSKEFFDTLNHFHLKTSQSEETDFRTAIFTQTTIMKFGLAISEETFDSPAFQSLLQSKDTYDLIILESFFGQEPLTILGHKFGAPIIAETSYGTPHNCFLFMGNPNMYSYMPDYKFSFESTRLTFLERLQNTLLGVYAHVVGDWWYFPQQDALMRKFSRPEDNLPHIKTLMNNISAAFIYSDLMLEYQRPQVSNLIHVAGIHLTNEILPKELEDILNKSGGFIYVSFGSIIQPGKMSEEMKTHLIKAFSRLRLTVLWRWKGEPIQNLSKNIIQRSWLPQQAVLAHHQCRLFITHGGINSVLEAIHYGVPMVGVPFYGDQPSNIRHMVKMGTAVEMSYYYISEESMAWAANTVLNNRSYKLAAIKARMRFNDRQSSPLATAIWWVEYVLRHHGAPHLRSAFDELSWTEFLLLDVLAFVLGVLLLTLYILLRILRAVKFCIMYPFATKASVGKKAKKA